MTGRTLGQPEKASATVMDSERSSAFLFPDPESEQYPPHIGCHPPITNPAIEPTSVLDHFAVNVEPYFVRSTASASEICPAVLGALLLFLLSQNHRDRLTLPTHLRVPKVSTHTRNKKFGLLEALAR